MHLIVFSEFQSTLPRRERHIHQSNSLGYILISIHTPTKGATQALTDFVINYKISIHTPTKGATGHIDPASQIDWISIHTPTKGATFQFWKILKMQEISIHTPTKGATYCNNFRVCRCNNFNPHSHEGSDIKYKATTGYVATFQSTLPRRERHNSDAGGKQ